MTASEQLLAATDEQTLCVVFANQPDDTVAATSTVTTYFPARFATRFSQRLLRLRPFVSVRLPPRV